MPEVHPRPLLEALLRVGEGFLFCPCMHALERRHTHMEDILGLLLAAKVGFGISSEDNRKMLACIYLTMTMMMTCAARRIIRYYGIHDAQGQGAAPSKIEVTDLRIDG